MNEVVLFILVDTLLVVVNHDNILVPDALAFEEQEVFKFFGQWQRERITLPTIIEIMKAKGDAYCAVRLNRDSRSTIEVVAQILGVQTLQVFRGLEGVGIKDAIDRLR